MWGIHRAWVLERVAMASQQLAHCAGDKLDAEQTELYRALDMIVRYPTRTTDVQGLRVVFRGAVPPIAPLTA